MDRISFIPMGRRRPWVLGSQLGIVTSMASLLLIPDPIANYSLLVVAGFVVNLFTAFQDVAVDGMAIDLLPPGAAGARYRLHVGGKTLGVCVATCSPARPSSRTGRIASTRGGGLAETSIDALRSPGLPHRLRPRLRSRATGTTPSCGSWSAWCCTQTKRCAYDSASRYQGHCRPPASRCLPVCAPVDSECPR